MVGWIGAPPSLPRVVWPWATDWAKHVAAKDEGAEIIHRFECELIVGIDDSASLPVHGAGCFGAKEPLKELRAALTERIVQALLYACAKTIQRKTKSCDSNLWHVLLSLKDFVLLRPYRAVFFCRRSSLSLSISFKSAAGRISIVPHFNCPPGDWEMS